MARKKQDKSAYTAEFRDTAIQLALAGDKSIAEVARELGLPEWKLYAWVQAWKKKNAEASVEQKSSRSAEERLRQQEKRIKQLEQENEILKKAAAYFAKTLL